MHFDISPYHPVRLAGTTKEIKMMSDGTSCWLLVHVLDMCQANLYRLEAPRDMPLSNFQFGRHYPQLPSERKYSPLLLKLLRLICPIFTEAFELAD
jgi:hypothetical protein